MLFLGVLCASAVISKMTVKSAKLLIDLVWKSSYLTLYAGTCAVVIG